MKNVAKTTVTLILLSAFWFIACKKSTSEPTKETEQTNTNKINPLTADVSGSTFTTAVSIGSGTNTTYQINFFNNTNKLQINAYSGIFKPSIRLFIPFTVGTHTLLGSGNGAYYDGFYSTAHDSLATWTAISGTINITQIDTTGLETIGTINKMKATFSFSTNINKNISHNVTKGVIDYTKP